MNIEEFENAYRAYGKRLFLIAYRLTGNIDEAEDILQDSFISAYSAWDSFRNESSRYTWLYRITIRRAYRNAKKTQGRLKRHVWLGKNGLTEHDFLESVDSGRDIESEIITEEVREHCLETFVACLPKKQRVVFTLRMILGFSVRETAGILEISEESAKVTLFRAKNKIREIVENRCDLFRADNPCSCWKWARHFEGTGKRPTGNPFPRERGYHAALRGRIEKESDFLHRLTSLYSREADGPIDRQIDERLKSILRDLIGNGRLTLLS